MLEHIDFVAVRSGEKVTVDVPVHVVGDAGSETLVVTENSTVQVEAEATNIPEYIEVSVEGADGRHPDPRLRPRSCPEGTTLLVDPETLVVNVTQAQTAEAARGRAGRGRGRRRHRARGAPTRPPPPRPRGRRGRLRRGRGAPAEGDSAE